MSPKKEGPDQARSWAIALAACVINTLLSGISRATGLLYVALIETYGVSRLQANLPFTMRNTVRNLAGPLVGAIGQRFGPRDVTIVGGVLSSLGIVLCYFAPNVIWITVLWGGIHGFGVCLGNTLFQVIVAQYFLKYRATASGLALSGACFGSFVFPILLEYVLKNYGLAGTFLLTGGLVMHVLPASIMLKEPPWIRKKAENQNNHQSTYPRKVSKPLQVMSRIQEESICVDDVCKDASLCKIKAINNSFGKNNKENHGASETGEMTKGIDNPAFFVSKTQLNGHEKEDSSVDPKVTEIAEEEAVVRVRLRTISFGEISATVPVNDELQESSISKGTLKVLKDPMFHMISLSLAAFAMIVDPSITVIVDYFMDKGLKADVAIYFISMMSLGDLVGRIGFGWVTDKNFLSVPKFMMILQISLGVCSMLIPLFNDFNTLMAVVILHGLVSGITLVMFPILVVKYLKSVQSLAIGFISFFTGLMNFAVPPVIGYFRDRVGSYDGMFFITGSFSTAMGFLWILEPLILRLGTETKKQKSVSVIVTP